VPAATGIKIEFNPYEANHFLWFSLPGKFRRLPAQRPIRPSKRNAVLFQRFHGKYKVLQATADEPLDLNFDGVASIDLKEELPNLGNCNLEMRLPANTQTNLFIEFWPEQVFGGGPAPAAYDPSVTVHYPSQSVTRTFQFSADEKAILLEEDPAGIDQQLYTRPATINILAGDRIEVIKRKRFYTTTGWKEVRVVSLYERYTMET
jgi:hypothetical protein